MHVCLWKGQYFVQQPLQIIHNQFPQSVIYHYIADSLLADLEANILEKCLKKQNFFLHCWGLQIAPEKNTKRRLY